MRRIYFWLYPELDAFPSRKLAWRALERSHRPIYLAALTVGLILVCLCLAAWSLVLDMLGRPLTAVLMLPVCCVLWVAIRLSVRERVRRLLRAELVRLGKPICVGCGYDITGVSEPRCPECGLSVTEAEQKLSQYR